MFKKGDRVLSNWNGFMGQPGTVGDVAEGGRPYYVVWDSLPSNATYWYDADKLKSAKTDVQQAVELLKSKGYTVEKIWKSRSFSAGRLGDMVYVDKRSVTFPECTLDFEKFHRIAEAVREAESFEELA